jgi:galactokinase
MRTRITGVGKRRKQAKADVDWWTVGGYLLNAVKAIKSGDLAELGRLFWDSHVSQRDDRQVSVPAVDLLVDLARQDADVYGVRVTGGGFGGPIVVCARTGCGRAVAQRITKTHAARSGCEATILVPLAANMEA